MDPVAPSWTPATTSSYSRAADGTRQTSADRQPASQRSQRQRCYFPDCDPGSPYYGEPGSQSEHGDVPSDPDTTKPLSAPARHRPSHLRKAASMHPAEIAAIAGIAAIWPARSQPNWLDWTAGLLSRWMERPQPHTHRRTATHRSPQPRRARRREGSSVAYRYSCCNTAVGRY